MDTKIKGLQIDHVELFVPNRYEAAAWYQETLGFEIMSEFEFWAEDPLGPLMISPDGGQTKLALFQGEGQGGRATVGFHRVAIVVEADGFIQFVKQVNRLNLRDQHGQTVTSEDVRDHMQAFSIYFCDPYGHRLEITTYAYEETRRLNSASQGNNLTDT